jgi:adenosylcobyric acid synthase
MIFDGVLSALSGKKVSGYEIHMGRTEENHPKDCQNTESDFIRLNDKTDGFVVNNVIGTYLHGIFDEDGFRTAFVDMLCEQKGISREHINKPRSYEDYREEQYDRLAEILRNSLNMEEIYRILFSG